MKSPPRLAAVDGLRAMAMLMVFTFHNWEFADKPHLLVRLGSYSFGPTNNWRLGVRGVAVFMVLSGFCLFFPLCFDEERLRRFNWRTYAVRRVRRIVPPYYAAIIYTLLLRGIVAVGRHFTGREMNEQALPSPFDLLSHVTFTHSLFPSTFLSLVGAYWSLGLEAQFYLVFPLVVWSFARFGARTIAGIFAVSLCYHAATQLLGVRQLNLEQALVVQNFFLGRWMEFGAGMVAAMLVANSFKREIKTPGWAGLVLALLGLFLLSTPTPDFGPLLSKAAVSGVQFGVAVAMLLYALCTSTPKVSFLWSNRISAFLGFISYSFFLIHQPTMRYLSQLLTGYGPKLSGWPLFIVLMSVGFLLCLAISYIFFLLFEKPFIHSWPDTGTLRKHETTAKIGK